ncbi:MAG TPA: hypothetical protein VE441_03125 [Mycobacterium sp.]|nr:hypothetical protein [Mycobacterium sp.]
MTFRAVRVRQAVAAVLTVAAVCALAACSSGTDSSDGDGSSGGGCVFGVEWNGVHYVDPAGHGERAKLPETSGHYLGVGHDLCADGGPSDTTWRLYSVPGVSPEVAVTTQDAQYIAIAEGKNIPQQLRMTGGTTASP